MRLYTRAARTPASAGILASPILSSSILHGRMPARRVSFSRAHCTANQYARQTPTPQTSEVSRSACQLAGRRCRRRAVLGGDCLRWNAGQPKYTHACLPILIRSFYKPLHKYRKRALGYDFVDLHYIQIGIAWKVDGKPIYFRRWLPSIYAASFPVNNNMAFAAAQFCFFTTRGLRYSRLNRTK